VIRGGGYLLAATLFAGAVALGFAVSAGMGQAQDIVLLKAVALRQGMSADWMIKAAGVVTGFGDASQRTAFAIAIALWLVWERRFKAALIMAVLPPLGNVASSLLKEAFARPRPLLTPHLDSVTNLAYPSGHAVAGAVFVLAAMLLPGGQPRLRVALGLAAMMMIGGSRLLLGVHWPSDVVGGWMIGLGFAIGGAALVKNWEGRR
jgi:undecaprenyl-diphosphatase